MSECVDDCVEAPAWRCTRRLTSTPQIAFGIGGGLFTGYIMRLSIFDPYTADFYQDSNEWNTLHLDTDQVGKIEQHEPKDAGSDAVEIQMTASDEDERIAALVRREVQRVLASQQANAAAAASAAAAPSDSSAEKSAPPAATSTEQ